MQTNEKRKNNILKVICLLITLIAIAFLVKYAWARYMSMLETQGNADLARWVFKVNGNDTQTTNVANFAITRTDNDNDSVKPNTLAPGTEGVFDIVIDAEGTDMTLQYFIDIDLIKKPENLKFYLKNGHTDEKIFLETQDNHLKTKGFMSLNDTKVRTERVFWIWELETGDDAEEIRINDEKDSEWIGKTMEMQISVTGMQSLGPGDVAMLDGTMAKYDFSEVSWYNINNGLLTGVNTNGFTAVTHNVSYGDNYLEFDGTSSWVDLGELNSSRQTIEATFSLGNAEERREVYVIGNPDYGGGGIILHKELYGDCIKGVFYINNGYREVVSNMQIITGKIYHVAIIYNGEDLCMYVNGIKQDEFVEIMGTIRAPSGSNHMALGVNLDNNVPSMADERKARFGGKIYSVAVYNRGLTEDEVAQNAQIALNKANNN